MNWEHWKAKTGIKHFGRRGTLWACLWPLLFLSQMAQAQWWLPWPLGNRSLDDINKEREAVEKRLRASISDYTLYSQDNSQTAVYHVDLEDCFLIYRYELGPAKEKSTLNKGGVHLPFYSPTLIQDEFWGPGLKLAKTHVLYYPDSRIPQIKEDLETLQGLCRERLSALRDLLDKVQYYHHPKGSCELAEVPEVAGLSHEEMQFIHHSFKLDKIGEFLKLGQGLVVNERTKRSGTLDQLAEQIMDILEANPYLQKKVPAENLSKIRDDLHNYVMNKAHPSPLSKKFLRWQRDLNGESSREKFLELVGRFAEKYDPRKNAEEDFDLDEFDQFSVSFIQILNDNPEYLQMLDLPQLVDILKLSKKISIQVTAFEDTYNEFLQSQKEELKDYLARHHNQMDKTLQQLLTQGGASPTEEEFYQFLKRENDILWLTVETLPYDQDFAEGINLSGLRMALLFHQYREQNPQTWSSEWQKNTREGASPQERNFDHYGRWGRAGDALGDIIKYREGVLQQQDMEKERQVYHSAIEQVLKIVRQPAQSQENLILTILQEARQTKSEDGETTLYQQVMMNKTKFMKGRPAASH